MTTVMLIGCTGVLGDIITWAVEAEPDIAVVNAIEPPGELGLARVDVDVVLWNNADEESLVKWFTRRARRCAPRILDTVADGRRTSLWELSTRRVELGELSPTSLVDSIRRAERGLL